MEELKKEIARLEKKLRNPNTPQGQIQTIRSLLHDKTIRLRRIEKEGWEKENMVRIYSSDDYYGMDAGNYSFYYGYEVTKCPVKSHKTDEYCYEKGCNKREWVFQAKKNDRVVFEKLTSELGEYTNVCSGEALLAGIGMFLQTLTN